jgi:hypothetical protein
MHINKRILTTVGLLSGVIFLASMTLIQQQQQEEPKPVNLKVLPKNTTHKQLETIMGHWASSLGVRCNFCHARNEATNKMDFASDAKPEKLMARKMFLMAEKINKKYFKAEKDSMNLVTLSSVNCYTCHHGVAHLDKAEWPKRGPQGGGPGVQMKPAGPDAPANGGTPPPAATDKKP